MKRRQFISLLGGAVAWPLAAHAQPSQVARIGALYIGIADAESFKKELREGLRELGYVKAKTLSWMAGTSPAMTTDVTEYDRNML
jgi:putative ABC transport system substrate-binding protein